MPGYISGKTITKRIVGLGPGEVEDMGLGRCLIKKTC
jgi:hypothetical protein